MKKPTSITAVIVPVDGQAEKISMPVDNPKKAQGFVQRYIGRDFLFMHDFTPDMHIIAWKKGEYLSEPNRAVYASKHHVDNGGYWSSITGERVTSIGTPLYVLYGDFIVIGRRMDDEGRYHTRSLTDDEVAFVRETFKDTTSGRRVELMRELGIIA